jgi:RHS repeat-associated protein
VPSSAPDDTVEYGHDGNMLTYGGWTFVWNGENRLIAASNSSVVISNTYDHMGRRITKTTKNQAQGTTNQTQFVYDGWAMIREESSTTTNHYVYGLDLSGSMQGAGTIGGILTAGINGTTAFYCYDANGNVTDLVGTNGSSVAHYEYGPFGGTIAQSGSLADDNPFRFSTKYLDTETDLYYYGYRFYSPELGRWVNRDPIGEVGGVHVYCFVFNNCACSFDINGLSSPYWGMPPGRYGIHGRIEYFEKRELADGLFDAKYALSDPDHATPDGSVIGMLWPDKSVNHGPRTGIKEENGCWRLQVFSYSVGRFAAYYRREQMHAATPSGTSIVEFHEDVHFRNTVRYYDDIDTYAHMYATIFRYECRRQVSLLILYLEAHNTTERKKRDARDAALDCQDYYGPLWAGPKPACIEKDRLVAEVPALEAEELRRLNVLQTYECP